MRLIDLVSLEEEKKQRLPILIFGLIIMLCTGILYMWSVFQPYVMDYNGWSAGEVSMTSAIMIAMFVVGNIVGGLFQEKVKPRIIIFIGCVMFALGMFLTSLLHSGSSPWMIYLTYSVVSGLGCGFAYCSVLQVLQKWYAANTGLITGLTVSFFGSSVVILSPVSEALLSKFGVPATFRILSIVFAVVAVCIAPFVHKPSPEFYMSEASKVLRPDEFKQFTAREMLHTPMYWCITCSMILSSGAYLVLVPFIKTIATGRGMSTGMALAAVMCTGVANAMGRILAPAVSDRIGRTRTISLCCVISALACVLVIFAQGSLYIVAVFLIAMTYGGTSGVNPVMATELYGAKNSATNYGFVMISIAISSIVFGRIASSVSGNGGFTGIFIACAILSLVPVAVMSWMHSFCAKHGKNI